MSRAVIYARYSSDRQRAESIGQQVDACRAYAEREGWEVVGTYADEARSGRTDRRDDFLRMVEDARGGGFDAVIVYKLDRFARNRYDAAMYRHKLRERGVRVVSAMEAIPDTPEGRLLESVMEGVAEWYSADLSQKVTRGMRANAERCLVNGQPVYGYRTGADGRYELDEAQAGVVRRAFAARLGGATYADVARLMDSMGARTSRGAAPTARWASHVLSDVRYTGLYRWGDVSVEGGMPEVVDRATFDAVQALKGDAAPRRHEYPLSGRLLDSRGMVPMCGTCGTGRGGARYRYYGVKHHGRVTGLVRADDVEAAVVRAVTGAFRDASFVEDVVAQAAELARERGALPEAAALRSRLSALDAEALRIVDAIAAGAGSLSELVERSRSLERERESIRGRLAEAESPGVSEAALRAVLADVSAHASDSEIIAHAVHRAVVYREEGVVVVTLSIRKDGTGGLYETSSSTAPSSGSTWWTSRRVVRNGVVAWRVLSSGVELAAPLAA